MGDIRASLMEGASKCEQAREGYSFVHEEAKLVGEFTIGQMQEQVEALQERTSGLVDTAQHAMDTGIVAAHEGLPAAVERLSVLQGGNATDEDLLARARQYATDLEAFKPSSRLNAPAEKIQAGLAMLVEGLEEMKGVLTSIMEESQARADQLSVLGQEVEARANSL